MAAELLNLSCVVGHELAEFCPTLLHGGVVLGGEVVFLGLLGWELCGCYSEGGELLGGGSGDGGVGAGVTGAAWCGASAWMDMPILFCQKKEIGVISDE